MIPQGKDTLLLPYVNSLNIRTIEQLAAALTDDRGAAQVIDSSAPQ